MATLEMLRHENRRLQALVSKYERDQHPLEIDVNFVDMFHGGGASSVIQSNDPQLHRPTGGGHGSNNKGSSSSNYSNSSKDNMPKD